MLDKNNYNTHGIEVQSDFSETTDKELINRLYELQVTAQSNPVLQEELQNVRNAINERGLIAKHYKHNDLFKEENASEPQKTGHWTEGLNTNGEQDSEDQNICSIMFNEAMKKQSQDVNIENQKVPDSIITDSYRRLKEKQDKGILGLEDETEFNWLETQMKIRKLSMSDGDLIPGGLADEYISTDFDEKALKEGIKVEMEHTHNEKIAKEIAMDHLTEDPEYYTRLKEIESIQKICDKLEETRYYESDTETIISKTAKELNVNEDSVREIYRDRYLR